MGIQFDEENTDYCPNRRFMINLALNPGLLKQYMEFAGRQSNGLLRMNSILIFILMKDLHMRFLGFLHIIHQRPFFTVCIVWQELKNPKKNAV
jgi:hypothetical protein